MYAGEFKVGKYDGRGEKFDNFGDREYFGMWKNGAYDGIGMVYKCGKLVKSGYWEKGQFLKELSANDCEKALGGC